MRKLLLAAAAIALIGGTAQAQPYRYDQSPPKRPMPPPPGARVPTPPPPAVRAPVPGAPSAWRHRQSFNWCRAKAQRLHEFEARSRSDGRVSRGEARIAASLRADLAASCGGGRWHPQRGWYYN